MSRAADWIDEKMLIPELLEAAPQLRPVLDRYGLRGCGGARGPVESVGYFAQAHAVPLDRLLQELRAGLEVPTAPAWGPIRFSAWAALSRTNQVSSCLSLSMSAGMAVFA